MRYHSSTPALALLALVSCAAVALAQDRTPLPEPNRARTVPATAAHPLPPVRFVAEIAGVVTGDEPDFAPMETYTSADGHHVRTRLRGNPYVLSFVAGDYTPPPGIDPRLLERQAEHPRGGSYAYIMIEGRMADTRIRRLQSLGVRVLDFHTWQCVAARLPHERIQAVASLAFVRWVGLPRREQKLGLRLTDALRRSATETEVPIYVNLHEADGTTAVTTEDLGGAAEHPSGVAFRVPNSKTTADGLVHRQLARLGFHRVSYDGVQPTYRGTATPSVVRAIAALNPVKTVELVQRDRLHQDQTMAMIGQDRVRNQYGGAGLTVGVIDSGIDLVVKHHDFDGKLFLGFRTDKTLDEFKDGSGHGTHVTGTISGTGKADPRYTGAAPAVGHGDGNRMFIGRYFDDKDKSVGDPWTLYDLFRQGYAVGSGPTNPKPPIVNNSWGTQSATGFVGTSKKSRRTDEVVFASNQLYVFSAGNTSSQVSGTWGAEPGVAKNTLTVGATLDTAPAPGAAAGWSLFGTKDNRTKPEVCAPGRWVTSLRQGSSTKYVEKTGTSMSAPTVTGALASVIERDPGFQYFPAGLKALAVASATNDGTLNIEAQRGWGQVDAYKMNYADKTQVRCFGGTLTKSGSFAHADVPIHKDTETIRVVLVMIEPPASSLATQARRNNIQGFIDLPPYDSGGDKGEFSFGSGHQTVLTYHSHISQSNGLVKNGAGQTVRFKAFAKSINLLDDVKFAVCVMQYLQSPNPFTIPDFEVKPATLYAAPDSRLLVTAVLRSNPKEDDVANARIWAEGSAGWTMNTITRRTADGIVQVYGPGNTHPSADYPRVGIGPSGGMAVGTGAIRDLLFDLQTPNAIGLFPLTVCASFYSHNANQKLKRPFNICLDNEAPLQITGLHCTTHPVGVWHNAKIIRFAYNKPIDVGCAGVSGVRYLFDAGTSNPTAKSNPYTGTANQVNLTPGSAPAGRYFRIRAIDRVGLLGKTSMIGPFFVDVDDPVVKSVVIDNGAASTNSPLVSVKVAATDDHSGVKKVRFSLDKVTWGAWTDPNPAGHLISLHSSALGGSSAQGTRGVWVQVNDVAGNLSFVGSDTIVYYRTPTLDKPIVDTLTNVTDKYFVLKGTNLDTVDTIYFAGQPITAKYKAAHDSDWATGYFRNQGSDEIWLYPPQGLIPGSRSVKVGGVGGTSNARTLYIYKPTARVVRSAAKNAASTTQTILASMGKGTPASVQAVIIASLSAQKSVIAGVFEFDIGGGFSSFYPLPPLPFNAAGVAEVQLTVVPVMVGLKVYFQVAYLDSINPTWPIPVSDVWSTSYVN